MSNKRKTTQQPDPQSLLLLREAWARSMQDVRVFIWGLGNFLGFVFTLDEHDSEKPVKRFPNRPHLRALVNLWEASQLFVVVKSRQLMVTWLAAVMILWDCLHPGRRWLVLCKKFEDADAILDRIFFIYQKIPEVVRPKVTRKQGYITIHHPDADSRIMAGAQDSDAPRSYTFTGILIDEASFTDNIEELVSSAAPTTMQGGKLGLLTTPAGRDFVYKVITDNERLEL